MLGNQNKIFWIPAWLRLFIHKQPRRKSLPSGKRRMSDCFLEWSSTSKNKVIFEHKSSLWAFSIVFIYSLVLSWNCPFIYPLVVSQAYDLSNQRISYCPGSLMISRNSKLRLEFSTAEPFLFMFMITLCQQYLFSKPAGLLYNKILHSAEWFKEF